MGVSADRSTFPLSVGPLEQWAEVYRYRQAVRNLVTRDLKVRYSNSALGIVWTLAGPLLMTLVYSLVFSFFRPGGISHYPVFILVGLLPWTFFTSSIAGATASISGNGHLINRVYFPREVLPVANLLSNAVNFGVALLLLFGFIFYYRIALWPNVLWLPVIVGVQVALMLGLGLLLAAVNVYLRDTQQLVDVGLLALFFLTPIIYTLDALSPSLQTILQIFNPMASLVAAYRQVLYAAAAPNLPVLGVTALQALLLLAVGGLVFRRLSPSFAEEV
ncbi:MAG: ABC transporter permease [Anaerolineales bacterium]|nr:ABC transporter permease [Anaerolineales bacterium]